MLVPSLIILCGFLAIYFLFRKRYPDFTDPDNAPPQFGSEVPHVYDALYGDDREDLRCCKRCGGGRNHKIHGGKVGTARRALKPTKDLDLSNVPGKWMGE